MSEFDDAIKTLEIVLCASGADMGKCHCHRCDQRRAAIRVLKAASKVDKGLCLFVFDRTYPLELESFPMIHDLLASLPDEETK